MSHQVKRSARYLFISMGGYVALLMAGAYVGRESTLLFGVCVFLGLLGLLYHLLTPTLAELRRIDKEDEIELRASTEIDPEDILRAERVAEVMLIVFSACLSLFLLVDAAHPSEWWRLPSRLLLLMTLFGSFLILFSLWARVHMSEEG